MEIVNLAEAKARLSELVRDVRSGAEPEVIIALAGTPAVRLVPYGSRPRRALGIDAGIVTLPADFDEPDVRIAADFAGDTD